MNFKKLPTIIFGVLIVLQSLSFPAQAEKSESSISRMANGYSSLSRRYANNFEIRNRLKQTILKTTGQSLDQAGHVGQTLVMMWILGATEILKKEIQVSRIQGRPMNPSEIFQKSGQVAEVILNSGSIWSGFLGAGIASSAINRPLRILQRLEEKTETRRILKSLIQSGAATFGTFVGWETAAELFTEASNMLENDNDSRRAEHLLPVFANTLIHGFSGSSITSSDDSRILQQIMSNMFKIVLIDSDLRSAWLYNTWRNRIATGQFVTMVTAMATSSAVGSLIFPGAGTIAGLMFGISGGLLALAVPENAKDRMTDWIQDARSKFWKLGNGESLFYDHIATVTNLLMKCIPQQIVCPPLLQYDFKSYAIEQTLTIASDRIRRYDLRLQELIGLKNAAIQSRQIGLVSDYKNEIRNIESRYKNALNDLKQVYATEFLRLQLALNSFQITGALTESNYDRYPQLKSLYQRYDVVRKLNAAFTELTNAGEKSLECPTEDYLRLIYKFSIYGFKEKELLSVF